MTHTVEDEKTSPYAPPPAGSQGRVPTLPEPPRFGDAEHPGATPDRLISDELAPPLDRPDVDRPDGDQAETARQAVPARPDDSIYRSHSVATPSEQVSSEEQKLASERAARKQAREHALAQPDVRSVPTPEPIVVTRRSTDGFLGALALFLLRIVVAAIMAIRGLEIVTNLPAAEALFATTALPQPRIMAIVAGAAALAIAVALVFGLLTRVAGLGVTLITGGALALVLWGNWSPFVPGRSGFVGELELLLAVVGLVFLCVGAGGFSLDRSFRKSREKDRLLDRPL